jgi:hypothetical protein
MESYYGLSEGRWAPMRAISGADPELVPHVAALSRVPCRIVWQQSGDHLHAYAKFKLPDGRVMMAHATTDLDEMERAISAEVRAELEQGRRREVGLPADGAVSGAEYEVLVAGWLRRKMRKLKNRIKKFAKKTGITKVVKAVAKVAKKALDNPLVQAALAATPYGAAFLVARKATQLAVSAVKGGKKAKQAIKAVAALAKKGDAKAKTMAKLIRSAVQNNRKLLQNVPQLAAAAGADATDVEALEAMTAGAPVPSSYFVGCGADVNNALSDETDIDALQHFAESGAWEGTKWLARRLSLHSQDARPYEYSERDALRDGRYAMGQIRARA